MLRKMYIFLLILLVGFSFSIGFVKPIDKDLESGTISQFANIMPGQTLNVSFLKQYNGETIDSITVTYDEDAFDLSTIKYGDPFIDMHLMANDSAKQGQYEVVFNFKTNQGEKSISTLITVSTNLVKGQLFFVGSNLKIHETKDIKYIVENQSDGKLECTLESNLAKSWVKSEAISLGPQEVKEYPSKFIANNVGDYEIQFDCKDNENNSLFKLGKQISIASDKKEEGKFLYFSYPVVNSVLNPFYALINYISDIFQ